MTSDGCTNSWTLYANMSREPNAITWTQQGSPNKYSEESCKAACVLSSSCSGVDYNIKTNTCWTGYGELPPSAKNIQFNQWTLERLYCGGRHSVLLLGLLLGLILDSPSPLCRTRIYNGLLWANHSSNSSEEICHPVKIGEVATSHNYFPIPLNIFYENKSFKSICACYEFW